jgi:flagellum-specific ATP synthase
MTILESLAENISEEKLSKVFGVVEGISGLMISCTGIEGTSMGSRCMIEASNGESCEAEIVGYKNKRILLMPFGTVDGIGPGDKVYSVSDSPTLAVNNSYIGRVIDGLARPVDDKGPLAPGGQKMLLRAPAPLASRRNLVEGKLDVGVKAINSFLTMCNGQRMGIFSGSGVGKSVLMSMIARYTEAEVNVIGLIGERGREVNEFIEQQLGAEGLRKSVIVVATGDEPPLMRRQAAYTTMAIAEYFRDCGFKVMLLMDSLTRFAIAQREIGLSAEEPPTTRGFTPSVFSELPRLLERAGPGTDKGSITAIFTVLVEGGDMDEPIADAVRGIVDGHIVLERSLAERGHFPSINILKSISRMVPQCLEMEEYAVLRKAKEILSTYSDMEELIRLGAYKKGSDRQVDLAIEYYPKLEKFLQQGMNEHSTLEESFAKLSEILAPIMGD